MLIYPLWLTSYHSGNGDQFFRGAMEKLGAKVTTHTLDTYGIEYDLMKAIEKKTPDLIFHVPYKETFRKEIMQHLTDNGMPTLCWNGDDEWLWDSDNKHNPRHIAKCYKWNVTTCAEALPKYREIGIKPILSQWGYSANDWKLKKRDRDIDVYFCGASTDERDRYLKAVMGMNINYSIDGPGYGRHKDQRNKSFRVKERHGKYTNGKVPFQVMLERYQRAKISVSFLMGASGNKPYRQVKARVFEIPAAGCFQLAYKAPEIERFFKIGKEIDVFETEEEMVSKIAFYLNHPALREKMAKRAQQRNLDYSYEKILTKIFKEIGL